MKFDTIIQIKPEPDKKGRRKGIPSRRDEDTWRRRVRNQPFEYVNTRTIHYETYRVFFDPYYLNGHNSVVVGSLYAFVWTGGAQAGDNLYDPATISYHFTFDGTTYTWNVTGSPEGGGDFSGATSFPSPHDPPIVVAPNFSASVHVVGVLGGGEISGTALIEPQWGSTTVHLTYRASRPSGSTGHWDDGGHPGVSVLGNNIQGSTVFYGGPGFEPEIHGAPTPEEWTAQIQDEADALIALLEAEPHIRNVSESDVSVDFHTL